MLVAVALIRNPTLFHERSFKESNSSTMVAWMTATMVPSSAYRNMEDKMAMVAITHFHPVMSRGETSASGCSAFSMVEG